jgi:hypothetical protein
MRKFTAIALLIGLSFWALSPEPSKAFADVEYGEVFVMNPQSGTFTDAHVETSDFSSYCLGAGDADGDVSWSKPRKAVVVLACIFPKSEDTAGNRTGGTFHIYFHSIAPGVYQLERITNYLGKMSPKEVYDFAAAVLEYAERTNLNRKATAGSFNPIANVLFNGQDTDTTPLEYARYCLDQGDAEWRHSAKEDALDCRMETEGDGNEGSATVVTFTYHFSPASKDKTTLIRITTDQGHTFTPAETANDIRIIRGTPLE